VARLSWHGSNRKEKDGFFAVCFVFSLTLNVSESIHSSAALQFAVMRQIAARENRQMATKKADKKTPAKKAAKPAAKKK
jgi:hypothetical protein